MSYDHVLSRAKRIVGISEELPNDGNVKDEDTIPF